MEVQTRPFLEEEEVEEVVDDYEEEEEKESGSEFEFELEIEDPLVKDILVACKDGNLEIKVKAVQDFLDILKGCEERELLVYFGAISDIVLNGEIAKIISDLDGVNIMIHSFLQSSDIAKTFLLSMLRNIISSSELFHESFAKNTGFIQFLEDYFNEIDLVEPQLQIAGIMSCLVGYLENKEMVKNLLEKAIFPMLQDTQNTQRFDGEVANALDCLMEASSIERSRPILLEFKTKEIIQPFVDDQASEYHFISCIIQALLSSSDINQENTFGSNPTSPKVILEILKVVSTFINTQFREYCYYDGYAIDCYNVLKAIASLARNEANMKELKNNGVADKIIELFKSRKEDLLKTNFQTVEEGTKVIWILSFDKECKDKFLSEGIVEILKGLNVKGHKGAILAIQNTLFALVGANQNQNKKDEETSKGQVMISYSWAQKEKAREVGNYLKSKGIPIWIDIEQMEGSVLETMAAAVEESSIILIFLSSNYKESQACRTEAEYAYKLKKEIVCVLGEENYQPRGWLGALLGNKLWYNPWGNFISIEEALAPILSQINKIFSQSSIQINSNENQKTQSKIGIQSSTQIQNSPTSQTTTSYSHNNSSNEQVLNILQKILNKMDGFESRLEKMEKRFEKIETQFQIHTENERLENIKIQQQFNQVLEKLETTKKEKKRNLFGK